MSIVWCPVPQAKKAFILWFASDVVYVSGDITYQKNYLNIRARKDSFKVDNDVVSVESVELTKYAFQSCSRSIDVRARLIYFTTSPNYVDGINLLTLNSTLEAE